MKILVIFASENNTERWIVKENYFQRIKEKFRKHIHRSRINEEYNFKV